MNPPTLRDATREDLPRVTELLVAQLREHGIPAKAEHVRAQALATLSDPQRGFVLVAERGGAVQGVAYVTYANPLEHEGEVAWLEELFVDPPSRDQGLGGLLLSEVIARADARGCVAVDLEIQEDHARVAGLYGRAGFVSMRRAHWTRKLRNADW